MTGDISLKMNQICKSYPGVQALNHVDFELRKGEVHALLGENGAGKSTLCKIIAGAQPMDSGEYYLFGERIEQLSPLEAKEKGIAMVYQEFNLVPYLKIYENLFLGKEMMHGLNTDKKAMIKKTKEVFGRFGKIFSGDNAKERYVISAVALCFIDKNGVFSGKGIKQPGICKMFLHGFGEQQFSCGVNGYGTCGKDKRRRACNCSKFFYFVRFHRMILLCLCND